MVFAIAALLTLLWWLLMWFLDRSATRQRNAHFKQLEVKHKAYLWQLRKTKRIKKRGNTVLFVVR